MKNYKLYNVLFPMWMLILVPMTWLIVIPANFIIDSLVLILAVHFWLKKPIKEIWKKSIAKVFVFGFLSDFVGTGFLLGGLYISSWLNFGTVFEETCNGPTSFGGFIVLTVAVFLSGICIYFADLKIAFKKLDLEISEKKKLALALAVLTAPYTFFIPLY